MGAGALALIACGGGGGTTLKLDDAATSREPGTVWFAKNDWKLENETKQAVRGGIYRGVRDTDQAGHFDAIVQMSAETPFAAHVYELLMARQRAPGVDPSSPAASEPIGALAESWEIGPDGLSITFTMRQGVKFHNIAPVNGRVMDMDDWKNSQERHLAQGVYRTAINDILDRAEFPDSRHMVWKLKYPFAPIFDRISHDKFAYPIQPKELNANIALAERLSIGTGYKILDKHQPAIAMEYRKHPDYWGGDPFIDRWNAAIVPEYSNRYAQFVSGNIIDFTPTARDVLLLHRDAANAVIVANEIPNNSATRMRFGRIDPQKQPWADPRVRVAMRRSIDFKSIGEFQSNKAEFEAAGIPVELTPMTHLPQNVAYWLNPEKGEMGKLSENYLYDPAAARALLSAAGLTAPVSVLYPISLGDSGGQVSPGDELVMNSFAATGTFKLDVERVGSRLEYNRYTIEGLHSGFLGTQSGSSDDADYFVYRDYHSGGRPDSQAYPHAKIDELGDAQRRELDVGKRAEILKEFQLFLAEWMATVPGRHLYTTFSFRWPWLRNANWGEGGSPPTGRPAFGGHLHWLDTEMPSRDKII